MKNDIVTIEAGVRYPEDGEVNGIVDDENNPKMPFMEKTADDWFVWKPRIEIATGKIVDWPIGTTAKVCYKVCDCCKIIYPGVDYDDYVPGFLAIDDMGYGDYIILTIAEDGTIKDWNPSSCREFLDENME